MHFSVKGPEVNFIGLMSVSHMPRQSPAWVRGQKVRHQKHRRLILCSSRALGLFRNKHTLTSILSKQWSSCLIAFQLADFEKKYTNWLVLSLVSPMSPFCSIQTLDFFHPLATWYVTLLAQSHLNLDMEELDHGK